VRVDLKRHQLTARTGGVAEEHRRRDPRPLFTNQPVGTDIWIALAWCVGILIVACSFAMVTYRRRIS
jgi:hypothetical protein